MNQPYSPNIPPVGGYPPPYPAAPFGQTQGHPVYPPQAFTQAAYPPGNWPPYPQPQNYNYAQTAPSFAIKQKDPRKLKARFTLNRTAAIVLLQVVASVVLQLIFMQICLLTGIDPSDNLCLTLLSGALAPICTAGPGLIYMCAYKCSWGDFLSFEHTGFGHSLLWLFAGLGLCIAGNYPAVLVESVLEMMGATEINSALGQGNSWYNFALELLLVAVLVPIVEEFAFRGVIFSALRPFGQGFAIVGSALIFGMAHLNLSSMVFATIAGLGMATAYAKTRNLWVTVGIHAANNGLSVIGSYTRLLPISPIANQLLQVILTLAPLMVGTISFILLLVIGHQRKRKAPPHNPAPAPSLPPLQGGETAVCILSTPLMWAVFALVLLETAVLFL